MAAGSEATKCLGSRHLAGSALARTWSAWRDLNPRPLAPQASALARLRYTPNSVICNPHELSQLTLNRQLLESNILAIPQNNRSCPQPKALGTLFLPVQQGFHAPDSFISLK